MGYPVSIPAMMLCGLGLIQGPGIYGKEKVNWHLGGGSYWVCRTSDLHSPAIVMCSLSLSFSFATLLMAKITLTGQSGSLGNLRSLFQSEKVTFYMEGAAHISRQ